MIKVNSAIKLNMPRLRQLTQAQITALEQTAEALHEEIANAQVVPMDTGNLTGESFFCDYSEINQGKATLVHSTPYARRLYFHPEYHFNKEFHADAKGKWFEDWEPGGKEEAWARDAYKRIYRRIAGL